MPEQESDITSVESSARSTSPPRRNGSVTNFESPVRHGNSIRTITQSASRADVPGTAGATRSPSVPVRQKHKAEHVASRSVLLCGIRALYFSSLLLRFHTSAVHEASLPSISARVVLSECTAAPQFLKDKYDEWSTYPSGLVYS